MNLHTLNRTVQQLRDEVRQLRAARPAVLTRETQVRPARTSEVYSGGSYSYPASPNDVLPVVFRQAAVSGSAATWTDRSSTADAVAVSQFGWLPPDLDVWCAFDGRRWHIVEIPTLLHGVASGTITAASWNGTCDEYTLGYGSVQLWRKSGSVYAPQEYADTDPVALAVKNMAPAEVAADTFLAVEINADNEWIVTLEPCDGACT